MTTRSTTVPVAKVAIVTSRVLMMTAANPNGAISRITKVKAPLIPAIEALRTCRARFERYMRFFCR